MVDWVWAALPLFTGWAPSVATNTPLPVAVGAVTVAVYDPLPLSVTEPIVPVPDSFVIVTVEPPDVSRFPFASFAVTVNTCVAEPFAVIDALVGVKDDCDASAGPGTYETIDCVWPAFPLFTA